MTPLNYEYNNGSYNGTLSTSDLAALENALNVVTNSDLTVAGQGSLIYNTLLSIFVNPADVDVSGTVDPNVLVWLEGAVGVNEDNSAPGTYIRAYTSAVYSIRYGTAPTDAQLNVASNEIAINLAQSIIKNNGLLPTIEGLGVIDAGFGAAANLFNQGSDPSAGVYSPWAGTMLFPFIGDSSFYQNWLLNMGTAQGTVINPNTNSPVAATFKSVSGTYDLVAALEAFQQTVLAHPIASVIASWGETTNPSTTLAAATLSFFQTAYGAASGQFNIGTGTPFDPLDIPASPNYVAGTLQGETLPTINNANHPTMAVGGPGNDTFNIVESYGIIDGGAGVNTVNFSQWYDNGSLTFTLEQPDTGYFDYRFEMEDTSTLGLLTDYLYSVQKLVGDSAANTVIINTYAQSFWSGLGQKVSVNLGSSTSNALDIDGSTIAGADVFSIAQGSSNNDVLVSAVSNDGNGVSATYGVDVTNPENIVVTAGVANSTLTITGNISGSVSTARDVKFVGSSSTATINATGMVPGETLEVQGGAGAVTINAGEDVAIKIDNPSSFVGTIHNLSQGDTIDLAGIGTASGAALGASNVLTVSGGSVNVTLDLNSSQNFTDESFITASDGNGGTNVTATSLVGINGGVSTVNPQTGAVKVITTALGSGGVQIGGEAAVNGYLYIDETTGLTTVNLSTGQLSSIAGGGGNFTADSLTGALVGVDGSNIVTVNPTTGATTTIATIAGLGGISATAETATNGFLYFNGIVNSVTKLISVNISTGQVTSIASTLGDFVGDNLTGALVGISGQNIVTVNPTTGATTIITTIAGLEGVNVVGQTAQNGVFYFDGETSSATKLYSVNIRTGQVTSTPNTAGNFIADDSVTVSVAQFVANNAGVAAGVSGFTIVDTAANILASISQLNAASAFIAAIDPTDQNVSLTVAQVNQFGTFANTLLSNGFAVADTAANIAANIATLETDATSGKLSSITLTDTGTPALALTAAQYSADAAALAKISSAYNLSVTGVSAANATTVAGEADVTSITVSDTAANVLANIGALETLATGNQLSSITLTDSTTPTLALTSAQDSADPTVLGLISGAYNLTVSDVLAVNAASTATQAHFLSETISDTAADFVVSLTSLETLAAAGKITSIAFTDATTPTITLTAAQQAADAAALAKITSTYNLVITSGTVTAAVAATATSVVAVSDTSANVLTYLSQLQSQAAAGRISSIAFTDGTTPTLALTAAQFSADATVLGTITSAFNLSISGVTAANASSTAAAAHVTSISVLDTGVNVAANIASLETLATGTELSAITLTDSTTPTLVLTASQLAGDTLALGKIMSPYNLSVLAGNVTGTTLSVAGSHGNDTLIVQDILSNNPGSDYNNILDGYHTSGNDTLTVGDGSYDLLRTDFSTGINSLTAGNGSHDYLDAESSGGANTLTAGDGTNNALDVSFSSGDNSLSTINGSSDYLNAKSSQGINTLTVGSGAGNTLDVSFSSGDNNLSAAGGSGDYLDAASSKGTNTLTAGSGANNTLDVSFSSGNNGLSAGNGSGDYLDADSSTGNNTLTAGDGNNVTMSASFSTGANSLTAGNGNDDFLNVGSSTGNNVLTEGNGNGDEFSALWSIGENAFNAGTGNTSLWGGEGYTTYNFGAAFGQDTIYNGGSSFGQGASSVQGEIDFTSSALTYENLWFTQSGSDLVVQLLGTTDTITVKGWFGGDAGAEVQTFNADGLSLGNPAVAALVSAMATYQSNNPGFNPATVTQMPANTSLQLALATAWSTSPGTEGSSEYDLFQNANSGQVYEWQLNGTSVIASSFIGNNTDPTWEVVGTGDFTGNGNADILFQNSNSGQVYEWLMNGFSVTGGGFVGNNTDPTWRVVGTGDFTGNGIDDVLFQNASSGQVYEWEMNGTSVIGSGVVGNNTDPTWRVVGTGDFTGNGIDDVLFQNANSGQVFEWEMNGTSVVGSGVVGNNTDPAWQVVGIGDFTGNGTSDILFQNANSGQVYEWEMNGTSVVGSGVVGNNTDPSWKVVGTGDFTGNGVADVLFQNVNSGQVYEWLMNGLSVIGGGAVGNNTDPTWHAVAKS